MKKTIFAIVVTVFCQSFAHSQPLKPYFYTLSIPQIPQADRCWCSISTLAMWAKFQTGNTQEQKTLAKKYSVGAFDTKTSSCQTNGLNVNQLADALENEGRSFNFSSYSSSSSDTFARKVASEVFSEKQPVAVVGNTRYKSGVIKPNQHYFLVDSVVMDGNKFDLNKISGFYMNDPAYNAGISKVISVSPKTFIKKSVFLDTYASKGYKNKYYLVED